MADLVNDIVDALKSDGLSDESICETHIGWVYFWSDSFLQCFVKQKYISVWILTVTICPPLKVTLADTLMHWPWGRVLKTIHLLLNTTTERSKRLSRVFILILETQMKSSACWLVVCSILPIDQKDSSSPTPERRDISESAPIIPTVSTLTNYQHARNAKKNHFQSYFPSL